MKTNKLIVHCAFLCAVLLSALLSSCSGSPRTRNETRSVASRADDRIDQAWKLFLKGARSEAEQALFELVSVGAPASAERAILEFRIAATRDMVEARSRAAQALAQDIGDRAKRAIAIMLGTDDLRDVIIDSPDSAEDYTIWLAGYRQEAPAALLKDNPLIVIATPESHGSDEATVQIAKLACRDALAKCPTIRVVDADSRRAALEELELHLASQPAIEKDRALGQLFSADYVVGGSIVASDSGWLIAWTLSSSDDGRILASDFSLAIDHSEIIASASRFASSLSVN